MLCACAGQGSAHTRKSSVARRHAHHIEKCTTLGVADLPQAMGAVQGTRCQSVRPSRKAQKGVRCAVCDQGVSGAPKAVDTTGYGYEDCRGHPGAPPLRYDASSTLSGYSCTLLQYLVLARAPQKSHDSRTVNRYVPNSFHTRSITPYCLLYLLGRIGGGARRAKTNPRASTYRTVQRL